MSKWLQTAMLPSIRKRCLKTAILVGILLTLINNLDRMLSGTMVMSDYLKIILTFFVPYTVCTFASVSAVLEKVKATN